jgi:hypothetical protein
LPDCRCLGRGRWASAGYAFGVGARKLFRRQDDPHHRGHGSGGGYDGAARLTARYLGKYIPGNPAFVVENMPGASGIKATNYLYAAAPKDGTVIATVNNSMPVYEAIGQEGVRFRADDLNWIGSLLQTATTVSIWHTAGVKTIEDAKHKKSSSARPGPPAPRRPIRSCSTTRSAPSSRSSPATKAATRCAWRWSAGRCKATAARAGLPGNRPSRTG